MIERRLFLGQANVIKEVCADFHQILFILTRKDSIRASTITRNVCLYSLAILLLFIAEVLRVMIG